jgi:PAP2 superfamily
LPRLILEPVAIQGPRNAMPSLHMSWTLLAWWYSRGLSWSERLVAGAFLAWTVAATLGTGEHWVADLIVAFPFALMIQALCSREVAWRDTRRLAALAVGVAGTAGWFIALRYGTTVFWFSPFIPWMLSLGTIALVCWRQNRLARAADLSAAVASGLAFPAPGAKA